MLTRPGLLASAVCKNKLEPTIPAPSLLFVRLSMVPIVVTPEPLVLLLKATQVDPFHIYEADEPGTKVALPILKLALPESLMYSKRPLVVTVGEGIVKLWPLVVWLTFIVVATSTVAAAVPSAPPVGLSLIGNALSKVLLALVKVEPVATVTPLLKVPRPVTVRPAPKVVRPPLTLKALAPVTVVTPFRETAPVEVLKVPALALASKLPLLRVSPLLAVNRPLAFKVVTFCRLL